MLENRFHAARGAGVVVWCIYPLAQPKRLAGGAIENATPTGELPLPCAAAAWRRCATPGRHRRRRSGEEARVPAPADLVFIKFP